MKQLYCKYCNRPMAVSFLEYSSNCYCNRCFEKRATRKHIPEGKLNTFEFMCDIISVSSKISKTKKINK